MVNSHYIPQFILRNFCKDEKIQYYNLDSKKAESRATRSVFSEKGYYPDNLEKSLCKKIEAQFANVLNNKILNERNRIILNYNDMLILKKYLIITMLRIKDDNLEHNVWYRELKRSGMISEDSTVDDLFSGNFFEDINIILDCDNLDKLVELLQEDNMRLYTFIKDTVYSYNVFVRTDNAKEDFIIPDRGWGSYRGPIGVKKLNALENMLCIQFDPYVYMLLHMSTPQDYGIYPLSSNLALIEVSAAFKMLLPSSPYRINFPPEAPTLSACLGFGDSSVIELPKNRLKADGTKEYLYNVHQILPKDVSFLNGVLLENAERFIGYSDYDKVKYSLKENGLI